MSNKGNTNKSSQSVADKANATAQQNEKNQQGATDQKPNGTAPQSNFQKAYALEDKRAADVAAGVAATQSQKAGITDNEAIKTDGTDNVNADKSLKTTEAQQGVDQEVRDGIKEQPNLNKTAEEQLGLANPDARLAEELREAKLSGNIGEAGKK